MEYVDGAHRLFLPYQSGKPLGRGVSADLDKERAVILGLSPCVQLHLSSRFSSTIDSDESCTQILTPVPSTPDVGFSWDPAGCRNNKAVPGPAAIRVQRD
jgi:hypothetical protein